MSALTTQIAAEVQPAQALARSMSLFDLDAELQALMDKAQEEEEDLGAVSEYTTLEIQRYFEATVQKVDRVAEFIKACKQTDELKKAEKHRLDERGRVALNAKSRVEEMLKGFMLERGITKVKGKLNAITLCPNSQPALKVSNPQAVPYPFRGVKLDIPLQLWESLAEQLPGVRPEEYIDEPKVKRALMAGEEVPGAELVNGYHVRIR